MEFYPNPSLPKPQHARGKSAPVDSATHALTRKYANKFNQKKQQSVAAFGSLMRDSSPSSPNGSPLFSQATEHESEAEKRILQALDRVRQQRQNEHHPPSAMFPSSMPDREVPEPIQPVPRPSHEAHEESTSPPYNNADEDEEVMDEESLRPMLSFSQRIQANAPSTSSLVRSTRQLMAMHAYEESEEEQEQKDELEELKRQEMAASAMYQQAANGIGSFLNSGAGSYDAMAGLDRMANAAGVLMRAKNAFKANVAATAAAAKSKSSTSVRQPSNPAVMASASKDSGEHGNMPATGEQGADQGWSPKRDGQAPDVTNQTPGTENSGGAGNNNNNNNENGAPSASVNAANPSMMKALTKEKNTTRRAVDAVARQLDTMYDLFNPKRTHALIILAQAVFLVIIPSLVAAGILFYLVDNPPTGRCKDRLCGYDENGKPVASASWWILFFGARQVTTWLLARLVDVVALDWLLMQHPLICRMLGARVTLLLVQSKGWPSLLFWWSIIDAAVLYGSGAFPNHWGYWQSNVAMFTSENPSGDVTTNEWYRNVIIIGIAVSVLVSLKRHYLGLHLGHRLCIRYHERLDDAMKKIALVSELAIWIRRKYDRGQTYAQRLEHKRNHPEEDSAHNRSGHTPPRASIYGSQSIKHKHRQASDGGGDGGVGSSQLPPHSSNERNDHEEIDYEKILNPWVEPKRVGHEEVSGNQIVQFRQAFGVMIKPYFLSRAFGSVETRDECFISADKFFRMMLNVMEDGTENQSIQTDDMMDWMFGGYHNEYERERAEDLIDLLGPDSNGRIEKLQFVKAIDNVYKEVRLLENAILNASHIDREYEKLMNFLFYILLVFVIYGGLGLDLGALIVALTTFILGFAFMIGPASAQVFEGVVLVLGRQPYDVGDRVAFDNTEAPARLHGSPHWVVEKVDLLSTTARLTGTNEIATFANGSIARNRIINMNRSPDPFIYIYTRFETDVPYSTILIFKEAVQKFIEERPQEWAQMVAFRTSRVEPEQNFVEYVAVLQHRLSWQNLGVVLVSKGDVDKFCVELMKQMGCHYKAPPKPVQIRIKHNHQEQELRGETDDDGNDVEIQQSEHDRSAGSGVSEDQALLLARQFESGRNLDEKDYE
ncbi:hypothetical protein ACA910_001282 [Epithemia clementina (nom. ined.)]